jgi:hypothetical protein
MTGRALALLTALAVGVVLLASGEPLAPVGGALLLVGAALAFAGTVVALLTAPLGPIERAVRGPDPDAPPTAVEGAALALVGALVLVALGALGLDALDLDVGASGLSWWLAGAAAAGVAMYAAVTAGRPRRARTARDLTLPLAGLASVLLLGGGLAVGIALTGPPRQAEAITGYSVLALSPEGPSALALAVENHEPLNKSYRLVVRAGRRTLPASSLTLRPGARWAGRVDLAPYGGRHETVTASLYTSASHTPYRSVELEPRTP